MEFPEFEEKYLAIGEPKESEFLIEFLFNLTIAYRSLSESFATDHEALDNLKQINEINHRVLNRLKAITSSDKFHTREAMPQRVAHHVGMAPEIASNVAFAASRAFEQCQA